MAFLEKALRFKGITAHAEGETFESVAKSFIKKSHLVDDEIIEAEKMAEEFAAQMSADHIS